MSRLLPPLLLCLLGCDTSDTSGDDAPPRDPVDYATTGAFTVGARTREIDGPDGVELPVEIWYPSRATEGDVHEYFGPLTGTALDDVGAACDSPRPVVVFSHGNTGLRYQSVFLSEYLASHGFVVAAPDHVGNTTFDFDDAAIGTIAQRRPRDVAATFDALARDPDVGACVDAAAGYAIVGHSFGGWTALATAGAAVDLAFLAETCGTSRSWLCQLLDVPADQLDLADPRVWAAVPMAPAGFQTFGADGIAEVAVPTLILGGGDDALTPWATQQAPVFDALVVDPAFAVRFEGASHYDFSDACALAPLDTYCDTDFDLDDAHAFARGMTGAFLDRVRLGPDASTEAWLPPEDPRLTWFGD